MALADEIRDFAYKRYIQPAGQRGERQVTIRAGDVHKEMELTDRVPAVCGALGTEKFQRMCNVRLINREGPTQGANVYFTFELL
jgi:5-methylcytosine-specific restriction protein B